MTPEEIARQWFDRWVKRDVPGICDLYRRGCEVQGPGGKKIKGITPVYDHLALLFDWRYPTSIDLLTLVANEKSAVVELLEIDEDGDPEPVHRLICVTLEIEDGKIVKERFYFDQFPSAVANEFTARLLMTTSPFSVAIPDGYKDDDPYG